MAKLDWSKADFGNPDPARVTHVGDYGILSDKVAGRKANPVKKRTKTKGSATNGVETALPQRGRAFPKAVDGVSRATANVSEAGATKPIVISKNINSKKLKNKKNKKALKNIGGNGLTIPELVARANQKVCSIEAEIEAAKVRIRKLQTALVQAKSNVKQAQELPRKSASGIAMREVLVRITNY